MTDWQDISTAPRDGRRILAATATDNFIVVVRFENYPLNIGSWDDGEGLYHIGHFDLWAPITPPKAKE